MKKKLICLTSKEDEELSFAEVGKVLNENIRLMKTCQTQEELMKLVKSANKYTLYMIHTRLGLGFPEWTRERTKEFYIRELCEYIANGCVIDEPKRLLPGYQTIGEFMRKGWDEASEPI